MPREIYPLEACPLTECIDQHSFAFVKELVKIKSPQPTVPQLRDISFLLPVKYPALLQQPGPTIFELQNEYDNMKRAKKMMKTLIGRFPPKFITDQFEFDFSAEDWQSLTRTYGERIEQWKHYIVFLKVLRKNFGMDHDTLETKAAAQGKRKSVDCLIKPDSLSSHNAVSKKSKSKVNKKKKARLKKVKIESLTIIQEETKSDSH